jgi:general stress protein YciG
MSKKGSMTVREAGKMGGQATKAKYGREFYVSIGRKGGQKIKKLIEAGKKALGES